MLKPLSIASIPPLRRTRLTFFVSLVALVCLLNGCSRIHPHRDMVYVVTRHDYLHDRIAVIANRVGEITNGEALEVLEHDRRFYKVKTPKGEIGWLEEHAVITEKTYDDFLQLAAQHKNDTIIAAAILRNDAYLHIAPGRKTQRFYLLPANAKVQLIVRASVPRNEPGELPVRVSTAPGATAEAPPPPRMEDWWLVRDAQGRTGWLLAGMMDVDVPDNIAQYSEGQRIVGAYVLNHVTDVNTDANGQTVTTQMPEYVTVLAPYKWGLPYDFDQVRVFTWNPKRHRYETAFRLRPIAGYLPVKVTQVPAPSSMRGGGTVPQFSILLGSPDRVKLDPETGITTPIAPRTINFQLLDTIVKRAGPDLDPIVLLDKDKDKKEAQKREERRRR